MEDYIDTAFKARLAYEKNCILKYDYPDNRPSRPPQPGDTMEDYARKFGTSIEEMKYVLPMVERELESK